MITSFVGIHRFLSNFYPAIVHLDGQVYTTVEHAYQAAKTLDERERAGIRAARTPAQAKRMGQRVTLRKDWEKVKLSVMLDLVRQKFSFGAELAQKLLDTGEENLVEGNNWGDYFWGMCYGVSASSADSVLEGENHLGRILMRVRDELRVC